MRLVQTCVGLIILLELAAVPSFAVDIHTLIECEALLVSVQKDSPVQSLARKAVRDSIRRMQLFRSEVLDPNNTAKPGLIHEGLWKVETADKSDQNAIASEISGIENHYAHQLNSPDMVGSEAIVLGLTRSGQEHVNRFFQEWLQTELDIQHQFGWDLRRYVIFSKPEFFRSKVNDVKFGMANAVTFPQSLDQRLLPKSAFHAVSIC